MPTSDQHLQHISITSVYVLLMCFRLIYNKQSRNTLAVHSYTMLKVNGYKHLVMNT